MIELHLPLPTSANDLWKPDGRGGLCRTDAYDQWLRDAGWLAKAQLIKASHRSVQGPYKLTMQAVRPDKRRRDLGNLLKATEDLLVSIRVIEDDSLSECITMRWVTVGDGIYVMVGPAGVE